MYAPEDSEIDILRAQNKALRGRVEALEEQLGVVRAFLRDAENVCDGAKA